MTQAERRKTEAALLAAELVARTALRRGLKLIVGHHALLHAPDLVQAAVAAGRDLEAVVARQVVSMREAAAVAGRKALRREIAAPVVTQAGPFRTPWVPPGSGLDAGGIGRRAGERLTAKALETDLRDAAAALRSRLDTIAATETSTAFNQARAREVEPGTWLQWSAVLDRQTCDLCGSLHGEIAQAGFGFRGYEPGSVHARCVPPGTLIATPHGAIPIETLGIGDEVLGGLTGRSRRVVEVHVNRHRGEVVRLRAGRSSVDLTDNHPVLTRRGWVPAGDLVPSDHVYGHLFQSLELGSDGVSSHTEDAPTSGDEVGVLSAIASGMGRSAVPVTRVDLDQVLPLWDSEVDIERADVQLRHDRYASSSKCRSKDQFQRGLLADSVASGSLVAFVSEAERLAAYGVMGGGGQALPSSGAFASHSDNVLFGSGAFLNASLLQSLVDGNAGQVEPLRNLKNGEPFVDVHATNGLVVDGPSTIVALALHASNVMPMPHVSMPIEALERVSYSGWVHNIGVDIDESYVANGLVVHNCRCIAFPIRHAQRTAA